MFIMILQADRILITWGNGLNLTRVMGKKVVGTIVGNRLIKIVKRIMFRVDLVLTHWQCYHPPVKLQE